MRHLEESTTSFGLSVSAARAVIAIGVSPPRYVTRQPRLRSEMPKPVAGP
jgi:hypothetical protein